MKAGFTLIEFAIVLTIAGLLIGSLLPLMNMWTVYRRQYITKEHIQDVREAMEQYISRVGFYPCPGPRIDMEANYPFAGNCMPRSMRDISDMQKRGVFFIKTNEGKAVIEGGVPYKRLSIPKGAVFDGWGNLYTYAVTGEATDTTGDGPNSAGGGIAIVNRDGKPDIDPPGSALWAVISHGPDGSGAYTGQSAIPPPCDTNHLDAGNCSHAGVYVADDTSMSEGKQHYDDMVFYRTWIEFPEGRYPAYCRIDNGHRNLGGHAGAQVQDGMFVKKCDPSVVESDRCHWLICHNGTLIPAIVELP